MSNRTGLKATRLLECPDGTDYDEESFRYFLAIDQARAARARLPLRVLLATLEPVAGQCMPFPKPGAEQLFSGLRLALRDTDVIGWYRQNRVAGVVLMEPAASARRALSDPLERRVGDDLRRLMPAHLASMLRVRVVTRGPDAPGRKRGTR